MNTHEDLPISAATVPADAFGLEPLLDVTELAAYLGVPVSTLYDWRTRGKGPVAYRFGNQLLRVRAREARARRLPAAGMLETDVPAERSDEMEFASAGDAGRLSR
jgi:Helix-turn-helix domain